MGLRIADYVDPEEMDVNRGDGIHDLLMFMVLGEDGEMTEEADTAIEDYKKKCKEYNEKRTELHAEAYEEVVLWVYQMDKRGVYTPEEFIQKVRELKKETREKRGKLEEDIFGKLEDERKLK